MNPLMKLLAQNKDKGQPIKAMDDGDEATIYLYDVIVSDDYWGGVGAESFVKSLNALTSPTIHVRVNSPGGDVFAARTMAQAIKEHASKIIIHVDGYAASAATFLVVAADESYINEGGMFMIHNAWTIAAGNASDFIDQADLLERIDQTLRNDYSTKTGETVEQVKDWMDAETYFFGQEAVDAGFVGAIAESPAKNKIDWDLSAYKHAPEPANKAKPESPKLKPEIKLEPEKPDLSAHYRQLEVVTLTA